MLRVLILLAFTCSVARSQTTLRVASYNASLNRSSAGALIQDLSTPDNLQARRVAEIIQRNAPDVLLVNEFDYDPDQQALDLFHDNYLAVSQNGQPAQHYPHRFAASSNTGIPSGQDFDNNGSIADPGDGFGFGNFPGQFGMAVYSKYPFENAQIRTFQHFLWKDMPDSLLPTSWYSAEEQNIFRLSSKSHWDIPVQVAAETFHFLVSHPTPPVFDGPEDRNGRRNHDEIRLWADYLNNASYIYDDSRTFGGLAPGSRFIIAGDQNADPLDGDSVLGAIRQLTEHPQVIDPLPRRNGRINPQDDDAGHLGDPAHDTADFRSGTIRVDYTLPSRAGWHVTNAVVYWPSSSPGNQLITASDHRLVYLDLELIPLLTDAIQNLTICSDTLILSWQGDPRFSYQIETTTDLAASEWDLLALNIQNDGDTYQAQPVATPSADPTFFRLRVSFAD